MDVKSTDRLAELFDERQRAYADAQTVNDEFTDCLLEVVASGVPQAAIARMLGITKARINQIVNRRARTAGTVGRTTTHGGTREQYGES